MVLAINNSIKVKIAHAGSMISNADRGMLTTIDKIIPERNHSATFVKGNFKTFTMHQFILKLASDTIYRYGKSV